MNPTELPTYPALQKMRAAFPDAAVWVELTQAVYSSGYEVNKYRATVVIDKYACDAESDDAMDAAEKCILKHAQNNPKEEAIRKAKATLEAAGYAITKEKVEDMIEALECAYHEKVGWMDAVEHALQPFTGKDKP